MCSEALRFRRFAAVLIGSVLGSMLCAGLPAWSQQPIAVETTLVAEIRAEPDAGAGRPSARFTPAHALKEGQELFYTLRIRNPSTEFARGVVVVQEIPKNTTYVPASAGGPGAVITFSADGGQSFAPEGQLQITDAAGASRPALPQDYTNIRWQLRNALAPGAIALARFRAVFR
jgi:uncharacterized repeat protein (TIGR01451 family)